MSVVLTHEVVVPMWVPDKNSTSGQKLIFVPYYERWKLPPEDRQVAMDNFWSLTA